MFLHFGEILSTDLFIIVQVIRPRKFRLTSGRVVLMLRGIVRRYRPLRSNCCFPLQDIMQAAGFFETSLPIYQITLCFL